METRNSVKFTASLEDEASTVKTIHRVHPRTTARARHPAGDADSRGGSELRLTAIVGEHDKSYAVSEIL